MKRLLSIGIVMLTTGACASIPAANYNTDFNNIAKIRSEKLNAVKVGKIVREPAGDAGDDSLPLRGGHFISPNGSFALYLEEALKQELADARLLDSGSNIELRGVLLKNMLNAAPFTTASAEIEARFVLHQGDVVKYDKTKTAKHVWKSSMAAAVAVPLAQQNYAVVVQKLLGSLFNDPDFSAALK